MTGSIVFASEQGLGYMAKEFYDHGILDKVLVYKHSKRETHHDWFPNSRPYSKENIEWLLDGIDKLLFFETPFDWKIIPMARERGIKTILMPMYECTQYPFPYEPDKIIAPSLLDQQFYSEKDPEYIRVPVRAKWRLRRRARYFIHNAGNGGLGGRNGTQELLDAMKYVKSNIKLLIRTQNEGFKSDDPRVEIRVGTVSEKELYRVGDVFIFPEKFNGLSLPLQEACASGMLVMAANRFPMNQWLPVKPLIPVKEYKKENIAVEFESAVIDPKDIAKTIDKWYSNNIEEYSLMGKTFGEKNSWEALKDKYLNL